MCLEWTRNGGPSGEGASLWEAGCCSGPAWGPCEGKRQQQLGAPGSALGPLWSHWPEARPAPACQRQKVSLAGPDTASVCQRGSQNTSGLGVLLLEPRGADKRAAGGGGQHEASAYRPPEGKAGTTAGPRAQAARSIVQADCSLGPARCPEQWSAETADSGLGKLRSLASAMPRLPSGNPRNWSWRWAERVCVDGQS